MKEVKINCGRFDTKDITELKPFQGSLKTLTEANYKKLKREILRNGFVEPISIWNNNILNGHQRLECLTKMRQEGYHIPKVPVSLIEADSIDDAKRIVLSLTSQYGTMTQESLYDYMSESDISLAEIDDRYDFAGIDRDDFENKFFKDFEPNLPEEGIKEKKVEVILKVLFDSEDEREILFLELRDRGLRVKV